MTSRALFLCPILASIALVSSSVETFAQTIRTVAYSGLPVAEAGNLTLHSVPVSTDGPIINDVGDVAFVTFLSGPGVTTDNNQGVWLERAGQSSIIAREGDQLPGAPEGAQFAGFGYIQLNNLGQAAFMSSFSSEGNLYEGIWKHDATVLAPVALEGAQAPDSPAGTLYDDFRMFMLNNAGMLAYSGYQAKTGTSAIGQYVAAETPSGSRYIARTLELALELAPGTIGPFYSFGLPAHADDGRVSFRGFFIDVGGHGRSGIWSGVPGNVHLIVREGEPASGVTDGAVFDSFGDASLVGSNAGHIAFQGGLEGANVTSSTNLGIWSGDSTALRLVARRGDVAVGLPVAAPFVSLFAPSLALNNRGDTAFFASARDDQGETYNGIWSEIDGLLSVVAYDELAAPGVPSGVRFSGFESTSIALNDLGQMAFAAILAGPGVTSGNRGGIWATDMDGNLQLIIREGDTLEVAPGVHRTIRAIPSLPHRSFSSDGSSAWFNNRGQIAFAAEFTDLSYGVFVSNRVAAYSEGDFDRDFDVDADDLLAWRTGFGFTSGADSDGDGDTDGLDLLHWQRQLGTGSANSLQPIPEPMANSIILISAAMGVCRIRSCRNVAVLFG